MMWPPSRTILPGLLLVILITGVLSDTQGSQDPDVNATEDQDVTLKCTHKISNARLLIWYKHIPGLALEICVHGFTSTTSIQNPRYSMTVDKSSLSTELHIRKVKGGDTAVYYCAVEDTVTQIHYSAVQESDTIIHSTEYA
ncbi:hypothetical protein GDO81_001846 [Engystomops pustulosus]|uniref:Ig-like domain-containing protein n=1 Tax=Engystomops pustulosus TaxID=76066 RepID=A0AAV7DFT4_ENGPU|nr:hypothetical protein GDO81_001846 [Engystomops pustulosus]